MTRHQEARRRTTCQVFRRDPVDAVTPTRVATLQNLAPAHAWVDFYCRKAQRPDAETVDPCTVRLQCGQQEGRPVAWGVEVVPETLFSYWPWRTVPDGTSDNLAAALVAAGKGGGRGRATDDVPSIQCRSGGRAGLYAARRDNRPREELSRPAAQRPPDTKGRDDAGEAKRKISGPAFKSEPYPGAVAFGSTRTGARLGRLIWICGGGDV